MNLAKSKLSDKSKYNYLQLLNELSDLISEDNQVLLIDSSVVKQLPLDDEYTSISLLATNSYMNQGDLITNSYNRLLTSLSKNKNYVTMTRPTHKSSYEVCHRILNQTKVPDHKKNITWYIDEYSILSTAPEKTEFQPPQNWIKLLNSQDDLSTTLGNYCTIIGNYDAVNSASYFSFIYTTKAILKARFRKLQEINFFISQEIVNHIIEDLLINVKRKSLQTSLTTVMSRNLSHNIGSHVLNNLSNKKIIGSFLESGFEVFYKMNHHGRRYHLSGSENSGGLPSSFINENDLGPIDLISSFNAYLKARMDFIADVGTSDQPAVYNATYLYQDVFALFEKNLLLLREISGKEDNFEYSFKLKLNHKENKKGALVLMPNALLGQQAFYILLENIIRNSAKHEVVTEDKVIFHINCFDQFEDSYSRDYIKVQIFSDIAYSKQIIDELVSDRNININEHILTNNNMVRDRSWGTIEMKVAAAYLSGVSLQQIDNDDYNVSFEVDKNNKRFPLIEAVSMKEKAELYRFGYQFFLKKPKLALILCPTESYPILFELLGKSSGIEITTKKLGRLKDKTYTHDFLLIVGENYEKINSSFKNLPQRVLYFNNDSELKIDVNFEAFLWQAYYNQILIGKTKGSLKAGTNGFEIISNKSRKKFIFNRHGSLISDIDKMEFFEPHSSSSLIGYLLNNQKLKRNSTLLFQCIEAVFTKILVIDERVQSSIKNIYKTESKDNNTGQSVDYRTIYQKTGIIVPDLTEINLNKKDMKSTDNLKSLVSYIEQHMKTCDFLVIHFGILEMLMKLDRNILETLKKINKSCKIILTSGRGRTKDIPIGEHFVNQSSFSYYLTNSYGRSKLHLTQLLKATR